MYEAATYDVILRVFRVCAIDRGGYFPDSWAVGLCGPRSVFSNPNVITYEFRGIKMGSDHLDRIAAKEGALLVNAILGLYITCQQATLNGTEGRKYTPYYRSYHSIEPCILIEGTLDQRASGLFEPHQIRAQLVPKAFQGIQGRHRVSVGTERPKQNEQTVEGLHPSRLARLTEMQHLQGQWG
jgi:hypothetical protein